MKSIAQKILNAKTILLSTHREADGDGLGSQLGLYHALISINKDVQIMNVDPVPKRYHFMDPNSNIENYEESPDALKKSYDVAVIFDTNDSRLLEPLYSELKKRTKTIIFIDHHPVLKDGPAPTKDSKIDVSAASTGEMTFRLIEELKIPLDVNIARAIYSSLVFDTQIFRFIRNSASTHLIAAQLLQYPIEAENIARQIFGNQTIQKMAFLSKALSQIEYFARGRVAFLKIHDGDLLSHALDYDASRDVVDMIMNVDCVEIAILFRQDSADTYKVSLRSNGKTSVLDIAESLGGGGHQYSAGAFLRGPYEMLKAKAVDAALSHLKVTA